MSGFFDDSHVTDVGLKGSAGRSVGFFDMVSQGFQQQFRVDSARALDDELRNRWLTSLRAAQIQDRETTDPYDPYAYRAFAQFTSGQPIDAPDANRPVFGDYDPTGRIRGMIEANEAIKKLNNPEIKSFEQILEEVAQMQKEVEGETASMSERAGALGVVGELLGAIGGSFTTRDPINIITAPLGAGRTVATRIASEMGLAAAITGFTEISEVAPARELVGLPERNPLFNIAAATLGAGAIRGGIEGLGYGVRRLRARAEPEIDFDLRDTQLEQMFVERSQSPSARAGLSILDDAKFVERNNPYGEGRAAQVRFLEELRQVQEVMGGAPQTAVARTLPPIPFEYIQKEADFALVKEQRPFVYAKMEAAQAKVADFTRQIDEASSRSLDLIGAVRLVDEETADQLQQLSVQVNDLTLPEPARAAADIEGQAIVNRVGVEKINRAVAAADSNLKYEVRNLRASRRAANREYRQAYREVEAEAQAIRTRQAAVEAAQQNQAVNIFATASTGRLFTAGMLQYDFVEARSQAINEFSETLDDRAVGMFTRETVGEQSTAKTIGKTELINASETGEGVDMKKAGDVLRAEADAALARGDEVTLYFDGKAIKITQPGMKDAKGQTWGSLGILTDNTGKNKLEITPGPVWNTSKGIDIGLKQPVAPDFKFVAEDGRELTIAEAMRDLQEDTDLDEAMRTCLL